MTTTPTQEPTSRTRDLGDQLRDLWATRPVRPAGSRKLAGVASAIGHRYDVDPVLLRVTFVVSAFMGGAGLALYVLCALLFKYQDDRLRVHETMFHRREEGKGFVLPVVLSIVFVFAGPWSFGGSDIKAASWVVFAALLVGLFALYRRRPTPPDYMLWAYSLGPRESMPPASPAYMMTRHQMQQWERQGRPGHPSAYASDHPAAEPGAEVRYDDGVTPPSWDPLGAARFAWDLPDPPAPGTQIVREERPKRGAALTWITLGLAVVAGIVAFVISNATTGKPVFVALAVSLAVVGAGMMLGSFRKRGLALLPIALVLGASLVATGIGTSIDSYSRANPHGALNSSGASEGFVGQESSIAADPAQLDQGINAVASDVTVSFTGLGNEDYSTEINGIASSVTLERSSDHNLSVRCDGTPVSSCDTKVYPATGTGNPDSMPTIDIVVNMVASEVKVH